MKIRVRPTLLGVSLPIPYAEALARLHVLGGRTHVSETVRALIREAYAEQCPCAELDARLDAVDPAPRARREIPPRVCAHGACGATFTPPAHNRGQKYCDMRCYYASQGKTKYVARPRECARRRCGKMFVSPKHSRDQQYCCKGCYLLDVRGKARKAACQKAFGGR